MKVLLVHPDDSSEVGAWAKTAWDLIIDLGWSGRYSYSQQVHRLGVPALSIFDLLDHQTHRQQLRELLDIGLNQMVDSECIDWWEVFSSSVHDEIEKIMLLSVMVKRLPERADILATRSSFATQVLSELLGREIKAHLPDPQNRFVTRVGPFLKRVSWLRPSQAMEIAFDKWDADYCLRRRFSSRPACSIEPAVLLPSAYVNVSRSQLQYAQMLPNQRFLLVVTRRSGTRVEVPPNVELRSLAAYVTPLSAPTEGERVRLLAQWQELQRDRFALNSVLGLATKLGVFAVVPAFLRTGLVIRDAWREVIAREPIKAVLSGDENNAFTRLPILLANRRNLRTAFCDHGALNMTFAFRRACSDVYLAPGDMTRDYLVEYCGLPASKVIIGAPRRDRDLSCSWNKGGKDWIVFFSAAYELASARTQTLYSEILPELCALARQYNRRVIVKLHPFESHRVRKAMIAKALTVEERGFVEARMGPMTPELLARAWFSVTVASSVAVESAMEDVPCFLCRWFDGSWYDYGEQFAKYSAGYPLGSPEEIRRIPHLLTQIAITEVTRTALQSPILPDRLRSVLSGV